MSQAKCDFITLNRRAAIIGAVAAAAVPIAATAGVATASDDFRAGCLARAEQVIDLLRTRDICEGWKLDEQGAAVALDYFRRGMPDEDEEAWYAAIRFFGDHGQSLDWIVCGNPAVMICECAARSGRAAAIAS